MASNRSLTARIPSTVRHLLIASIIGWVQERRSTTNRRRADRIWNTSSPLPNRIRFQIESTYNVTTKGNPRSVGWSSSSLAAFIDGNWNVLLPVSYSARRNRTPARPAKYHHRHRGAAMGIHGEWNHRHSYNPHSRACRGQRDLPRTRNLAAGPIIQRTWFLH